MVTSDIIDSTPYITPYYACAYDPSYLYVYVIAGNGFGTHFYHAILLYNKDTNLIKYAKWSEMPMMYRLYLLLPEDEKKAVNRPDFIEKGSTSVEGVIDIERMFSFEYEKVECYDDGYYYIYLKSGRSERLIGIWSSEEEHFKPFQWLFNFLKEHYESFV